MAADAKYVGIVPGRLYEQEGADFTDRDFGPDEGTRIYLTHPDTPRSKWPLVRTRDAARPGMIITGVTDRTVDRLIELTVSLKGVAREKGERIEGDTAIAMFGFSALVSGKKTRLQRPVPVPVVTRSYVTTTQPTLAGVGLAYAGGFLPAPPAISFSYTPDPEEVPTINMVNGWVLTQRRWELLAEGCWFVTETFSYFYNLAT